MEDIKVSAISDEIAELVSIEECKNYVKYDVSDNDIDDDIKKDLEKLELFRKSAIRYLYNATEKTFINNPIAKTYVLILVNEMFENYKGLPKNDVTSTKNLLLAQLRYDNDL